MDKKGVRVDAKGASDMVFDSGWYKELAVVVMTRRVAMAVTKKARFLGLCIPNKFVSI